MKKMLVFFVLFICALSAQTKKICQLGMDPVDVKKVLDRSTEAVVKIGSHQEVLMGTGSGRKVRCILPPGTPVVVEKSSGVARWIFNCGNPISEPQNWIPQGGVRVDFEQVSQPAQRVVDQPAPQPALSQPQRVEVEVRHGGQIDVRHSGEVIVRPAETQPVEAPPAPRKSWWQRNRKWVIPFAIAGAAAGGYAAAKNSRGREPQPVYYQPLPPPIKR